MKGKNQPLFGDNLADLGITMIQETASGLQSNELGASRIRGVVGIVDAISAVSELEHDEASELLGMARRSGRAVTHTATESVVITCTPGATVPDACVMVSTARAAQSVIHEVRNALQSTQGWAKLAMDGRVETDTALQIIETASKRAVSTTEELLSTVAPVNPVCDLRSVLQEVLELHRPAAEQRGIELSIKCPESVSVSALHSDVFTIFRNLVSNAVSLTTHIVTVTVEVNSRDVAIHIGDDGIGMNEAEQARVFDPHFSQREGGTGLGLALVRRSVIRSGGSIGIASTPHVGTVFSVRFSQLTTSTEKQTPNRKKRSGVRVRTSLAGSRILVVEDDAGVRELVRTALKTADAEVLALSSANAALNLNPNTRFDLALLDQRLGGSRGIDLAERLVEMGLTERCVIMTGDSLPGDLPFKVIRKPFDIPSLIKTLGSMIQSPLKKQQR